MAPPQEIVANPALAANFTTLAGEVPEPASYDQWFRTQDSDTQRAAVGAKRYAAVRDRLDRRPDWRDFIGADGAMLSPQQLKSESDIEREARRQEVGLVISEREKLFRQVQIQGFAQ